MTASSEGDPGRPSDWLTGSPAIVYQRCRQCGLPWYLPQRTCERCGADGAETLVASGEGVVHATSLVHRAPSPELKEITPYLLIFVDALEGFRMMAHGDPSLRIGDRVRASFVIRAGRMMPLFSAC